MADVYWAGEVSLCETCDTELQSTFYDAATSLGGWAIMCPSCHHFGPGLGKVGPGAGQFYRKQPDGRWKKVAG